MRALLLGVLQLVPRLVAAKPVPAGQAAPAFSLSASNGETVSLKDFLGKRQVVLAFFPKAFTPGCTREMSGYRDFGKQFTDTGAQVLGISMDKVETQKKFAESLKLPFPLLADPDGRVAKAYGVGGMLYADRVTFVIDKQGKIVKVIEGKEALDPGAALSVCAPPEKH